MTNNKLFGMESAYILLLVLMVSALCLPAVVCAYTGEPVLKYQASSPNFVVEGKGGTLTLGVDYLETPSEKPSSTQMLYIVLIGGGTILGILIILFVFAASRESEAKKRTENEKLEKERLEKERREWESREWDRRERERREWERREWEQRNMGRPEWDNRDTNRPEWWESNDRDRR